MIYVEIDSWIIINNEYHQLLNFFILCIIVAVIIVKPNFGIFPPLLHALVNYSDFAGCQVQYYPPNVAVNIFQSSVLQQAVIF